MQAIKLAKESDINDFCASNGWLYLFKKRNKYVMRRVTKANKITAEKKKAVITDFHEELNVCVAARTNLLIFFEELWNANETMINAASPIYCQPKVTLRRPR